MPRWITKTLAIATAYYLILGLTAILWPRSWYVVSGIYPEHGEVIMAALGATLVAFGIGAAIATFMARSQWGLIVILLAHNVCDLGIVVTELSRGRLGILSGVIFALVDIAWACAFGGILFALYRLNRQTKEESASLEAALSLCPIGSHRSLGELSAETPLLIILVRHAGCTFCRSHLATLVTEQRRILEKGYRIVVVSMSPPEEIDRLRAEYPLPDAVFVSDPHRTVYRALGARRGSFFQLFGPRELWRGLIKGELFKHGLGEVSGDPTQLGGTFIVKDRAVVFAEPATSASDICPLGTALERVSA